MSIRVAINGFGRIGRAVLRVAEADPEVEIVHINDLTDNAMLAHLLAFDSVHGRFPAQVEAVEGGLSVGGRFVSTSAQPDPTQLPWGKMGIDVVLECTGRFTSAEQLQKHLQAGAGKVILSAPAKGSDVPTYVVGVNDHLLDPSQTHFLSNASCTTNCLAPLAKVLHGRFGIQRGLMNTIHSYTMDQMLLDSPHKGDYRRARAAALHMVPTSTGAAKAVGLVLPELKGKLNGLAIRVPTPNVSLVDLTVEFATSTSVEEVNGVLSSAAEGELKGILGVSFAPLVSGDFNGDPRSSIVDAALTAEIGGNFFKVLSWYDNEWGFSNRMVDMARILFGKGRR